MKSEFRFGSVPYMNAKPLCWALRDVQYVHPPVLLKLLESGQVDAALLSSIEYFRRPGEFDYVRGLGVCSDGPVASVRLYSRRPQPRNLALDPNSLTANALAQIRLGKLPTGVRQGSDWSGFDATVVIGDDALRFGEGEYVDLGTDWKERTGLPFVYALWIVRKGAGDRIGSDLREACKQGATRLEEIARSEAARLKMEPAFCLRYLKENVYFEMGPREEKGLELFGRCLKESGLL